VGVHRPSGESDYCRAAGFRKRHEPITRWYLQLPWPACFAEHRHLPRFQLAFDPEELERYRPLLGKQVTVKGTLEEGVPGRHTTSLVIDVYSLARWERDKP
jgi:hypothetical protein